MNYSSEREKPSLLDTKEKKPSSSQDELIKAQKQSSQVVDIIKEHWGKIQKIHGI